MKRVNYPSYVGKVHDCGHCGGSFVVGKHDKVQLVHNGAKDVVAVYCPYCGGVVDLNADVNARFREKLSTFIHSQVAPIRAITSEDVRLPLQRLLDDINALVEEE